MVPDDDVVIAWIVGTKLGMVGHFLSLMEPAIDAAIGAVEMRAEEEPDNQMIPITIRLFMAAKELIAAHRVIDRVAGMMQSGSLAVDTTETIQ